MRLNNNVINLKSETKIKMFSIKIAVFKNVIPFQHIV